MRLITLLIILFVLTASSAAAMTVTIDDTGFEYKVYENDTLITEGKDSNVELDEGQYKIIILKNDNSTDGYDYAYEEYVDDTTTITPSYEEVGTLFIRVRDKGPVKGAFIRTICNEKISTQQYYRTNEHGNLEDKHHPTGSCRITVAYEDTEIRRNIELEQGKYKEVTFRQESYWWIYPIIILFLALLLFTASRVLAARKKKDAAFLSEKEKAIVEYMTQNLRGKPHEFYLHQHQLSRGTDIAKTTLMRVIEQLEKKDVVKVVREGKAKRIYFSDKYISNYLKTGMKL